MFCALALLALWARPGLASPTIHVAWAEAPPPDPIVDYSVDYDTDPNYPNVELKHGSLTWKVWSTESGGSLEGAIGTISCPHPQNFAVSIANPDNPSLPGAAAILGIDLVPSGTGSENKYSHLIGSGSGSTYRPSHIGYFPIDPVFNLKSAEDSGAGGDVSGLTIDFVPYGDVWIHSVGPAPDSTHPSLNFVGDIEAPVKIDLMAPGAVVATGRVTSSSYDTGALTIGEMGAGSSLTVRYAGNQQPHGFAVFEEVFIGTMAGTSGHPTVASFEGIASTGVVYVGQMGDYCSTTVNDHFHEAGAVVHVGEMDGSASLDISCPCADLEDPCAPCNSHSPSMAVVVDQMSGTATLTHDGPGTNGSMTVNSLSGAASVHGGAVHGPMSIGKGILQNAVVQVNSVLSGGSIDLNDQPVEGTLSVQDVSSGLIANVGEVSGNVGLAGFSGSAVFASVASTGSVTSGAMSGSLRITGDVAGTLRETGIMSGATNVDRAVALGGLIDVDSLGGSGSNVNVNGTNAGTIHVRGTMSSTSMVKVTGGLPSGGLVMVNDMTTSASPGTIWIGGTTKQSPLPELPFDGAVRAGCGDGAWTGLIKIVGCASSPDQPADVCSDGGTVTFVHTGCSNSFVQDCSSSCP